MISSHKYSDLFDLTPSSQDSQIALEPVLITESVFYDPMCKKQPFVGIHMYLGLEPPLFYSYSPG